MTEQRLWTITEVVRMTNLSSRTLRHYDEIGLLHPARTTAAGYRCYGEAELARLQQILLLRELRLPLESIAAVLDGACDRLESLRRHHEWLTAEAERLRTLSSSVASTIASLEEGVTMPASEWFDGFSDKQEEFEQRLTGRYGSGVTEHFATSRAATANWSADEFADAARTYDALDARMCAELIAGAASDDAAVMDVLDEHFRAVSQFWTPTAEQYAALGQLYVDDSGFRARYDALDPALAEFYRDAMAAYAVARL